MSELWQFDAIDLARMIREGSTTSVEVVTAHLDRIDAVNARVNAVVRRLDGEALTVAAAIDAAYANDEPLGPLAGVPFTIKENIDLAGSPTTDGVVAQSDAIAEVSAPAVEHLVAAGAVPLARTNLPDLALRVHTDSQLHGLTRNPWHPDRTAGGSSGGEAAAIATGMSPLGLGNDLGGSLRNPASCCSIASIKPTTGRVAQATTVPMSEASIMMQLLAVEGPMGRRIADVTEAFRAIARPHVRDPLAVPFGLDEVPRRPMRVAVMSEPPGHTTDPRIADATLQAADALRRSGCHVDAVDAPRFTETVECWRSLVAVEVKFLTPMLRELVSDSALRFFELAEDQIEDASVEGSLAAWMARQSLQVSWARFFQDWDAILTPTWTQLPFPHGHDISSAEAAIDTMFHARATMPANVLGLPSVAVPSAVIDGLPVGMLVTGAAWTDMRCLHIAGLIEATQLPSTPIDPFVSARAHEAVAAW